MNSVADSELLKDAKLITSIYNTFEPGSARIAGGFLRDLLTGREPKDIDIVVEYKDERDIKEAEILANRLGYDIDLQHAYPGADDNMEEMLICVAKLSKEGKLPIDLIFSDYGTKQAIQNFPCNASMVWLDGDELKTLPPFHQFIIDRQLEFYDAKHEYIERLQRYYPNDGKQVQNKEEP